MKQSQTNVGVIAGQCERPLNNAVLDRVCAAGARRTEQSQETHSRHELERPTTH